jgi:septal ring factor EnvC (AmiA/AmiB activator)
LTAQLPPRITCARIPVLIQEDLVMRHPTAVLTSAAMTLALADIERRQARQAAAAFAARDARTMDSIEELGRRLTASRKREAALERELRETRTALAEAQGALLRLTRQH